MSKNKSILNEINPKLPSLNQAVEMQKKAANVGFDWPSIEGVIAKIYEEIEEVKTEAVITNNHDRIHDEIGDLLFACTNLARHLKVNPEEALRSGNSKFYNRFIRLEQTVIEQGLEIKSCSLIDLDKIWNEIKHQPEK
jgi:nucleoside triphosphate diphosphatase